MLFPRIIAAQRLQVWLLVTALVSLALTGLLVFDLTRNLRSVVISDTSRNLANAVNELRQAAAAKGPLPAERDELDRVLKPVSYEVLRSHADIEGGYHWRDQVAGHTFPTYTEPESTLKQPEVESNEVRRALSESQQAGGAVAHRIRQQSVQSGRELVEKQELHQDEAFATALQAVLEVLPVSSTFTKVEEEAGPVAEAAGDFDALERLRRLMFTERVPEHEQLRIWTESA